MTKGGTSSCLDCLWHKIDLALKQEAAYYNAETYSTDDDDDSSAYSDEDECDNTDNDDTEADDEADDDEANCEKPSALSLALQRQVSGTNLFQAVEGRGEVFHNIMKRLDSVEELSKLQHVGAERIPGSQLEKDDECAESPRDRLESILRLMGVNSEATSYKSLDGFFVQHTPSQVEAYDNTVIGAVRRNDVDELRRLQACGRDLQCCNQFGESIVHTVARRGNAEMVRFLVSETPCSLRVCCDNGRNPLHDACWTSSPNFDVVRLILQDTPDFLLVADNRNFTPLDYVPRDAWAAWCQFLDNHQHLLKPSILTSGSNAASEANK